MRSSQGQKLLATKDQAGDVVGLAGLADEILDANHKELEGFLGGDRGKIANQTQPASVGEFLASGVEGFYNAVGKKDEDVTRA